MVERSGYRTVELVEKIILPGRKIHILFSSNKEKEGLSEEEISLVTDKKPRKIGLKLLIKAIMLLSFGIIFTATGIISLTWL